MSNEANDLHLQPGQPWSEHGYFLDLLHDIQEACLTRSEHDIGEIPVVISSLTELFMDLFVNEESLMNSTHYPDLIQHKSQHREMRFHLQTQAEKIARERSFEMLSDFCGFFSDWLIQHEHTADAKFHDFLRKPAQDIDYPAD